MTQLIREKKFELLCDCNFFDKNGELKKTKEVTMLALKFSDSDKFVELSRELKNYRSLEFLCEKGYITPVEGGKLKIDDLDFRAATILVEEYVSTFLDILSFLPIRKKDESSEKLSLVS